MILFVILSDGFSDFFNNMSVIGFTVTEMKKRGSLMLKSRVQLVVLDQVQGSDMAGEWRYWSIGGGCKARAISVLSLLRV